MKNLVVVSHSFRLDSRLMQKALRESRYLAVVYPSPWYYNLEEKEIYSNFDCSFHKKAVSRFARDLKDKTGLELHVIKSNTPCSDITSFCKASGVNAIYYDTPLFGKDELRFNGVRVIKVDSDSYDDRCEKMTAKSRWVHWSKNRKIVDYSSEERVETYEVIGEKFSISDQESDSLEEELSQFWKRFESKLVSYYETRNMRDGSLRISKFLHHGVVDGPKLISNILSVCPEFIDKENPMVPVLRQLAFREINIRKSRIKNLSLTSDAECWARALLDQKSFENLLNSRTENKFTKEQLFAGETGDETLDEEIKSCKKERWLPNRIRMWLAGEVYWNTGGGLESLKTLVEFFDRFCDDAQSPNNWVGCTESMKMQYGKVMRFNKKRTFRLISGKEII